MTPPPSFREGGDYMAVDRRELALFTAKLKEVKKDVPEILSKIAVGEGQYAVKQARLICKTDPSEPGRRKTGVVSSGEYRRSWQSDDTARRAGSSFIVRFYNPLDYAKPLEYGFRSHFVPGYWNGNSFVYQPGFPGGMQVGTPGGFVRGHFTLKRAVKRTLDTQQARVNREIDIAINRRMK